MIILITIMIIQWKCTQTRARTVSTVTVHPTVPYR